MVLIQKIVTFSLIFLSSTNISAQKNVANDSLKGFDSTAIKQFVVQNNLNSVEQILLLSKKKREFKNAKYNLTPLQINQSAKLISSNNSVMAGNLDFEAGNLNGWNIVTSQNVNSVPVQTCCANSTILATALNSGTDPNFGFNLVSPLGGNYIARLNSTINMGYSVTTISNTVPVAASTNFLKIAGKYVFEGAFHNCNQQPYVKIKVTDLSGTTTLFSKFIQANEVSQGGLCSGINLNSQFLTNNPYLFFTNNNWDISCIDLSSLIGSSAIVEITVGECSQGGHGAYAYFDLLNTGFTPVNNTININNTSYSITSQPFNIGICNSNTAIAVAPTTALSYTWFGNGINGSTSPSVQINQAGNYTLVSTMPNNSGCGNSTNNSTVQFTVGSIAPITANASPTLICGTSPVNFSLSGASNYSISSTYGYNTTISGFNINIGIIPPVTCSYFITGINPLGCSATKTINIQVNPQPTVSISGNNFCVGNTGTILASGADNYTWVNGTTTLSTTNQLVLTPTNSAFYTVTGTNTLTGCSNSYGFNSQVSSSTLSAYPTAEICFGNSIVLTASGSSSTYTWNLGTLTTTNMAVSLSPTVTTTYTLSSNNFCGNISTPITLTVNPLPNLVITGPSSVCPNSTYTWVASGANNYVYTGIAFSTFSSLIANVNSNSTPYINLTGTDIHNCQSTTTLNLTILSTPILTVNPFPLSVCSGNTLTINALGANSYTWSTGDVSNSISVSPTVNTCYSFTATGTNGCLASWNNCVNVNALSATITPLANTYSVCDGNYLNLNQTSQCCGVSYSINNQYVNSLNLYTPLTSGNYTLAVGNGCAINQATFNVAIIPLPTASIAAVDSACYQSQVTLTLSGGTSYYCYNPSVGSFTTSNSVLTFTLVSSGFISVQAITANGCAGPYFNKYIKAIMPAFPYISPTSATVCAGSSIVLTATASAPSFTWSNNFIGNSVTLTPTTNTAILVSCTGTNGCVGTTYKNIFVTALPAINATANPTAICVGANTSLNVSGANSYTWSNSFIGNVQTVTPTISGIYTVAGTAINNPCSATTTVSVVVDQLPNPGFNQSQYSLCSSQSAIITVTGAASYNIGPGPVYTFTLSNPSNSYTMQVIGYSAAGCSKTATVAINVFPNPVVVAPSGTTCMGSPVTLTASGANTYTWSTGSLTNTTTVNPITYTTYSVIGADLNGCASYQYASVFVYSLPTLTVNATPPAVCYGNSTYLTVSGASTYTWSNGSNSNAFFSTPIANTVYTVSSFNSPCVVSKTVAVTVNSNTTTAATSTAVCFGNSVTLFASGASTYSWSNGSNATSINITPTSNISYSLTGTDINGCVTATPAISNVTVNTIPSVNAVTNTALICTGQSATLTANGANTYSWNTNSPNTTIVVSPTVNTTYTVTGTDANGCENFATVTQSVSLCTGNTNFTNVDAFQIIISPNPSTGVFNVNFPSIKPNSQIEASNSLGQLLFQQKVIAENTVIDLSKYASGIYYLKVKQDDKQEVIKLIKE